MKIGKSLHTFTAFRNFLPRIVSKEFLIFLFFLALSGGFWLIMTLNETYEREFTIGLRMADVPRNVVITSEPDSVVRFTVRDKGYMIAAYEFLDGFHPVFVDYRLYTDGKSRGVIAMSDVQRLIYQQLAKSSRITSVKSDKLSFLFNFGHHKKVPVRLLGTVAPGNSYYLAHVDFSPDSVQVYAARQVLDSIQTVYTERQQITNFTDVKELTVDLRKFTNVKCVPAKVKMRLFPDVLTEETVEVPIEAINMPADKVMRTFPSKVAVKFVVGAHRMRTMPKNPETKELLSVGFRVVVNYKEVEARHSDKCHVYLLTSPNGVRNARPVVDAVDYLIEQR
ncbi:MAG: YbbR-like domain-containing protein [Prevotella sp.]|nr:YbbR-like domain-containing protein [Prevotella sp.]